jgi:hypothetical protein
VHRDLGGLSDVSTKSCVLSNVVNAKQPFVQEAAMFDNFANCVANLTSSSSSTLNFGNGVLTYDPASPTFWAEVSMQTQLIIDSILESDVKGGVLVNIPQTVSLCMFVCLNLKKNIYQ